MRGWVSAPVPGGFLGQALGYPSTVRELFPEPRHRIADLGRATSSAARFRTLGGHVFTANVGAATVRGLDGHPNPGRSAVMDGP